MSNLYSVDRPAAALTAPLETLGIEVTLPGNAGRTWLDGASSWDVLHGAPGDTTGTVAALRSLYRGWREPDEAIARCFLRIPNGVLDEEPPDLGFFPLEWLFAFAGEEDEESTPEECTEREREQAWANADRAWRRSFPAFFAKEFRDFCIDGLVEDHDLQTILSALGFHHADEDLAGFMVREDLIHNHLSWEANAALFVAVSVAYETLVLHHEYADGLAGGIGSEPNPIEAMRELIGSRMVCMTASGSPHDPRWSVGLAARLSEDTPALVNLRSATRDALKAVTDVGAPEATSPAALADVIDLVSRECGEEWISDRLSTNLMAHERDLPWLVAGPEHTEHPYVEASLVYRVATQNPPPGWPTLVDLDDPADPEDRIRQAIRPVRPRRDLLGRPRPLGPDDREVLERLDGVFGFASGVSERLDRPMEVMAIRADGTIGPVEEPPEPDTFGVPADLRAQVARFGERLAGLDLGLDGMRIDVGAAPTDRLDVPSVYLSVREDRDGRWVPLADLEPQRHRMVHAIVQVWWAVEVDRSPVAVLGTGVGDGLTPTASEAICRELCLNADRALLATTSPVLRRLSAARHRRLRVTEDGTRSFTTTPMATDGPGTRVPERRWIETVASKHLIVVVDRLVDRVALEELARSEAWWERILVLPGLAEVGSDDLGLGLGVFRAGPVADLLGLEVADREDAIRRAVASMDALPAAVTELLWEIEIAAAVAAMG